MGLLFFLPFILQTIVIFVDEFYFHIKRDLPRWERIGHPLDTLSVLFCFIYVLVFPYDPLHRNLYIALALFSCLLVTKDEFVHKHCCPASEHWLYALLFLNHPVVLCSLGILWYVHHTAPLTVFISLDPYRALIRPFFWIQGVSIALFALYQLLYWNVFRKKYETN